MRLAIFLILSFSYFNVIGQNINETLKFANQLYQDSSLNNAIEAYKRVLFFDTSANFSNEVYPKIADCLYKTQNYEQSAIYYDLAYFTSKDSLLKNDYLLSKISCFLILKNYDFAKIETYNLSENLTENQIFQKDLLEGMLFFALNEFKNSEVSFKKIIKDSSAVNVLFRKNDKVSKLSPKKAKILSIIMPGLGQFYVGDIKNGLNSFLLTSGLVALGLRSAVVNSPIDALVTVMPWFQRYYKGGIDKAELIAIAKIQEKRYKIYNKLLDEVENQ
jgi:tetratricopeptide (TPR) repeat protein